MLDSGPTLILTLPFFKNNTLECFPGPRTNYLIFCIPTGCLTVQLNSNTASGPADWRVPSHKATGMPDDGFTVLSTVDRELLIRVPVKPLPRFYENTLFIFTGLLWYDSGIAK